MVGNWVSRGLGLVAVLLLRHSEQRTGHEGTSAVGTFIVQPATERRLCRSRGERAPVPSVHFDGHLHLDVVATEFSEAKESAVDAIGAASGQAGVAFSVIRPTAYFSRLTNRAFDSGRQHGRYTVIGEGLRRINPVDGDDVAVFIADCIGNPKKAGREHQIGGPDIFTFREIGLLAA
jgi:uncharacterized protein YbjT (DUF2867 family)